MRINREKTECKKFYVGLGISESFADYQCISVCYLNLKKSWNRFVMESIYVSAFISAHW
jgi:hypothetical protein